MEDLYDKRLRKQYTNTDTVENNPKATVDCGGKPNLNTSKNDEVEENHRSYAEVVAGRKTQRMPTDNERHSFE